MSSDPSANNRYTHKPYNHKPGRRDAKVRQSGKCADTQAQMFAFLDGDLDAARMRDIRAHLDVCELCRHEWELCRQSDRALNVARDMTPPPGDLRAGFYSRLVASAPPSRRQQGNFSRYGFAGLALAVGMVAFLGYPPTLSSHRGVSLRPNASPSSPPVFSQLPPHIAMAVPGPKSQGAIPEMSSGEKQDSSEKIDRNPKDSTVADEETPAGTEYRSNQAVAHKTSPAVRQMRITKLPDEQQPKVFDRQFGMRPRRKVNTYALAYAASPVTPQDNVTSYRVPVGVSSGRSAKLQGNAITTEPWMMHAEINKTPAAADASAYYAPPSSLSITRAGTAIKRDSTDKKSSLALSKAADTRSGTRDVSALLDQEVHIDVTDEVREFSDHIDIGKSTTTANGDTVISVEADAPLPVAPASTPR